MTIFRCLYTCLCLWAVSPGVLPAQTEPPAEPEVIALPLALRRAVENDPRMGLNAALADAAQGQVEQADLPPNPVIGGEAENFLGTGPITGVQGLELTLGISQVIETADKRARRTTLARRERDLVDWQRELLVAEVEAEVRAAFVDVLLAQELVTLRARQLDLARQSETETARLVEAARSPQLDLTRATLAARRQTYALEQAQRELATAKANLAVLWGEGSFSDFEVEGSVVLEPEVPSFGELAAMLPNTAELARYEALRKTREAALDLEKARAVPDFEIYAGGRYYNEDNGNFGFVAGFEIPWPLFDRNQGNIRTARAQVRAVEYEREALRRELLTSLHRAYQVLVSAHAEAISVQADLLPGAEQALADTSAGYERGQYTQLAVLESRQTFFEIREASLVALQRYAAAQAQIQALTRPAGLSY
ncbi:TolC family protein [Ruficoccus amylovorans]|uniref:TolC family protein n=1 Tax=Ruficoccus amylovorans TaxID=1804625 RepID=A0A842HCM7_9BACT|nr:TolC family protein [Ruficoccus amylovorans]MBC2593949.1 TolC family protein [Ruficoccus amylovorans]